MFAAHVRKNGDIQSVEEHCQHTAQIASVILSDHGLMNTGYLAGLLHDMGKCSQAFHNYIMDSFHGNSVIKGSVVHTFAGVRLLLDMFHKDDGRSYSDISCELIAYAVGAHHGLFDVVDEDMNSGFQYRREKHQEYYHEIKNNYFAYCADEKKITELFALADREITDCLEKVRSMVDLAHPEKANQELFFYIGLLARFLLSAVMEGDRTDTAYFMAGHNGIPSRIVNRILPDWKVMLDHLENHISKLTDVNTPVGRARKNISEQCAAFCDYPAGLYRLNVPTGGGKTLSAMRFALAHAKEKGKRRIIYVAPLISILEQNVQVIRRAVGKDEYVLEHHSNVIRDENKEEELAVQELLVENWDAPIIVTTLVQLLNTLFLYKTSNIRRFHALANSVLILDEVQTVPTKMLTLFNLAMNFLSGICGTTVLLCSATQPCFEKTDHAMRIETVTPVSLSTDELRAFQRTKLNAAENMRLEEIPDFIRERMDEANSLLVICNKRSEAGYLYAQLRNEEWNCFYLSASMCMANRRNVLERMTLSLKESRRGNCKTLCVATQVIEAGVDVSFESVVRFSAGMDSVIQAAGRCNRNGESERPAPVYVINCSDESLSRLDEIQAGKQATERLLYEFQRNNEIFHSDLASDAAIEYYYQCLYAAMNKHHQDDAIETLGATLFDLLSINEKYYRKQHAYFLRQSFKTAGKYFSVFDTDTTDAIVPYKEGKEIIQALLSLDISAHMEEAQQLIHRAKQYTVSLYQYEKDQLEKQCALISLAGKTAFALEDGFYSADTGLILNPDQLGILEV